MGESCTEDESEKFFLRGQMLDGSEKQTPARKMWQVDSEKFYEWQWAFKNYYCHSEPRVIHYNMQRDFSFFPKSQA